MPSPGLSVLAVVLFVIAACDRGAVDRPGGDLDGDAAGAGDSDPRCTVEECDGIDNDCDAAVDEGCPCVGGQQSCGISEGACVAGTQSCTAGVVGDCVGAVGPSDEVCDGIDNDCDGVVDEGLGPRAAANIEGECAANIEVCDGAAGFVAATSNYQPSPEQCDGLDNDCVGGVDDGIGPVPAEPQEGECLGNTMLCDGVNGFVDDLLNYLPVAELCDGLDNDCALGVDDGLSANPELCADGLDNNCDGLEDLEDVVACPPPSTILNPFYTDPVWRLWVLDQTPVHYFGYNLGDPIPKEGDFSPTALLSRRFPDLAFNTYPYRFLALANYDPDNPPAVAGSWDDGYATRDGAHSNLGNSWSDSFGNSFDVLNQYVRVPFGSCQPADILRLGINFTSESYASSGHQLVSAPYAIEYTERNFAFVNTVRATPAYLSYAETISDRVIDSYDALYAHSFNSVGRSSSEVGALFKMLVAGSYMPRGTKDLLKLHGAYGLTLINLFRATLPYAEADGTPVGIASEMLQRPAYFSNGGNVSQEFVPRNTAYHQYDESQHLRRMVQAARDMTVAPPVAVLRVLSITVESGGTTLVDSATSDPRLRSVNQTMVRVWGNPGETISLRVDAGASYDLQGRALTFEWLQVYPEQENISIVAEGGSVWRISVTHDPALPKGRIPVALFAENGAAVSNPAFLNFYWPEAGQNVSPPYVVPSNPVSTHEVLKNRRPLLVTSLASDWINVLPGATASFDVDCTDPDGFPVRYYRWLGEVGSLSDTAFTFTPAANDPGLVYPVHLICSDGTGGYGSLLVRVSVTTADGVLPATWQSTAFGLPEAAGTASFTGDTFEVVGNGPTVSGLDHGRIVFQELSGDVDLTVQVVDFSVDGSTSSSSAMGGIMIRDELRAGARDLFAYVQGNSSSTTPLGLGAHVRPTPGVWPGIKARDATLGTQPNWLRAVRRGNHLVGLGSTDGLVWEQIWGAQAPMLSQVYAGLAVLSSDTRRGDAIIFARGRFKVMPTPTVSIPIAALAGTLVAANTTNYRTKATVTLVGAATGDVVHYTLDGTDPTDMSPVYSAPFDLTTAGAVILKAKSIQGSDVSDTVVVPITITP